MTSIKNTVEYQRLQEDKMKTAYWRKWGPYLSARQWGTVREDYSSDGEAWDYFPHEHARSRAYRWGEDGIGGISDNHQRLCFSIALWNENDSILKERFFGLNSVEGNHGEDVKEYYFYLDSSPTHSYMKFLYKYPTAAYPYRELIDENRKRSRKEPEYELIDTGIFDEGSYFDVFVEYAKKTSDDIFIKITAKNRGKNPAPLHLLPTLWFRNTWSWDGSEKPLIKKLSQKNMIAKHSTLGSYFLYGEGDFEQLYTENETNENRVFGTSKEPRFVKDAFHDYLIHGDGQAVNPACEGTKAGLHYRLMVLPGEEKVVMLRLCNQEKDDPFKDLPKVFEKRLSDTDEFYDALMPQTLNDEDRMIKRQALSGMLWSKQFYFYVVERWLEGDPASPPPPKGHKHVRNYDWPHLYNDDVLSMPDKWEYPWYASWDLAFQCIPFAMIDPDFAKRQLSRLTREWYMHPSGQIPAYEWDFSDVNPPVQAWAALRVYEIEYNTYGVKDRLFLERVFQKLLLNFTWWVNRKDLDGRNIFEGGFLGLDNISLFDRSSEVPTGGYLNQSDGTSWMAMFCLNMLKIALELAKENICYEDIASKFFEHFLFIAEAMTNIGPKGISLWNEEDGFFYDVVNLPDGSHYTLKVHSLVGLIPLFAVMTLEPSTIDKFPGFKKRFEWFLNNRKDLCSKVACMRTPGEEKRRLLAIVDGDKLKKILEKMLDPMRFLSENGIRSLSAFHGDHPVSMKIGDKEYSVDYEPAESTTPLFGGNSNWRGPVWFPVNFLLIESLYNFHQYLGDDYQVEYPTGSGNYLNLREVAIEISQRLIGIFRKDKEGERVFARNGLNRFSKDPNWKDYLLFNEYFHGDTGAGLGASHQTGWTGIVSTLIKQCGE